MNTVKLCELAGVSYRQLDHWTRNGWLKPIGGTGSGNDRDWPPSECDIAVSMGRLVKYGIMPSLAHDIARAGEASGILLTLARVRRYIQYIYEEESDVEASSSSNRPR
jgi:hypothetical protein